MLEVDVCKTVEANVLPVLEKLRKVSCLDSLIVLQLYRSKSSSSCEVEIISYVHSFLYSVRLLTLMPSTEERKGGKTTKK